MKRKRRFEFVKTKERESQSENVEKRNEERGWSGVFLKENEKENRENN